MNAKKKTLTQFFFFVLYIITIHISAETMSIIRYILKKLTITLLGAVLFCSLFNVAAQARVDVIPSSGSTIKYTPGETIDGHWYMIHKYDHKDGPSYPIDLNVTYNSSNKPELDGIYLYYCTGAIVGQRSVDMNAIESPANGCRMINASFSNTLFHSGRWGNTPVDGTWNPGTGIYIIAIYYKNFKNSTDVAQKNTVSTNMVFNYRDGEYDTLKGNVTTTYLLPTQNPNPTPTQKPNPIPSEKPKPTPNENPNPKNPICVFNKSSNDYSVCLNDNNNPSECRSCLEDPTRGDCNICMGGTQNAACHRLFDDFVFDINQCPYTPNPNNPICDFDESSSDYKGCLENTTVPQCESCLKNPTRENCQVCIESENNSQCKRLFEDFKFDINQCPYTPNPNTPICGFDKNSVDYQGCFNSTSQPECKACLADPTRLNCQVCIEEETNPQCTRLFEDFVFDINKCPYEPPVDRECVFNDTQCGQCIADLSGTDLDNTCQECLDTKDRNACRVCKERTAQGADYAQRSCQQCFVDFDTTQCTTPGGTPPGGGGGGGGGNSGGGGGGSSRSPEPRCGDGIINQAYEQCDFYYPKDSKNPPADVDGCSSSCKLNLVEVEDKCDGSTCVCLEVSIDRAYLGHNQTVTYTAKVYNNSKKVAVNGENLTLIHESIVARDPSEGTHDIGEGWIHFPTFGYQAKKEINTILPPAKLNTATGKYEPSEVVIHTFTGRGDLYKRPLSDERNGVQILSTFTVNDKDIKRTRKSVAPVLVKTLALTRNSGNIFTTSNLSEIANIEKVIGVQAKTSSETSRASDIPDSSPVLFQFPKESANFSGVVLTQLNKVFRFTSYITLGNVDTIEISEDRTKLTYLQEIQSQVKPVTRNVTQAQTSNIVRVSDIEKLGTRPDNARIFVSQGSLTIGLTEPISKPTTIIVEKGDVTISSNITYKNVQSVSKDQVPTLAIVVREGNIKIAPEVTELWGVYAAINENAKVTNTYKLSEYTKEPLKLVINGLVIGNTEELNKGRSYVGADRESIANDEVGLIMKHDGRIYSYPAPGLLQLLGGSLEQAIR